MHVVARVLAAGMALAIAVIGGLPGPAKVHAHPTAGPHAYRVTVAPDGQPPLSLYVEEMGRRGPVVLLLHGLGGSSYSWRHVAPRLAATHRVIAIDLRGFGRSDKPFDLAYSPADHAAVVRAFIRQQRLFNVTVVGHSFGGLVTLLLAMDGRLEPHRIARIAVMDSPAFQQPFSPGVDFLRRPVLPYVVLHLVPPEVPTAIALMMEKMGFETFSRRDISIYADPLLEPGGPHALIETARQIVPPDIDRIVARYRTLSKPALVLWCRDDQVVPLSTGVRLARTLPRARLVVLDGCDHVPAEQAPGAVVAELQRFLGR